MTKFCHLYHDCCICIGKLCVKWCLVEGWRQGEEGFNNSEQWHRRQKLMSWGDTADILRFLIFQGISPSWPLFYIRQSDLLAMVVCKQATCWRITLFHYYWTINTQNISWCLAYIAMSNKPKFAFVALNSSQKLHYLSISFILYRSFTVTHRHVREYTKMYHGEKSISWGWAMFRWHGLPYWTRVYKAPSITLW